MIGQDRIGDLLSFYVAERDAGRALRPEDLCRDCPELLAELNRQIRAIEGFERLAEGSTGDFGGDAAGDTDAPTTQPDSPPAVPVFERYEVLEELGRGGMGVVYRARDKRSGRVVALKTMKLGGGRALELFKGEFRYLQGVSHPNLVQLYGLEADRGRWLLTMEFVDGVNFRDHLRPTMASATAETPRPDATPPAAANESTGAWLPENTSGRPVETDPACLRDAFGQLAEGIAALHAHRRVHRDLKPQNVRVAGDGRVVVLDFGLTAALDHTGEYLASVMMGTAAYMAPEQGNVPPVATAASDWYAFGVMLYEALTGVLPFRGRSLLDLLAQKGATVPPRPRELSADAPEDLDTLCMDLLDPRPENRPAGGEVLRAFGRGEAMPETPLMADAPLLGRERHLAELDAAYVAVGQAGAVVVKVSGPSGIGKSALVGHFLDQRRAEGAVVLSGRCYEHESVPFKALDPLVDELARYMHGLPEDEVASLVPAEVGPLVRVFPVLERVEPIAEAAADARLSADPQELRRQAFAGLRELLGRLARTTRLVLHVDDLQWGDVDSAYLIADLIQPPDPPAALWVLAHRSEDARSACLTTLAEVLARSGAGGVRELAVAPLTENETSALVATMLGPGAGDRAAEIARESGGNPFFVLELVRSTGTDAGPDPGRSGLTLDGLIRSRVARLPDGARRLLELVAVSGRPLRDLDAYTAAGTDDARTLMARLEAGRFLRGVGPADELLLETYHDRVREAVAAGLDAEVKRAHHGRLAEVLESSGRGDVEELALHFEGAGSGEKAGGYYRQAGDRAASALAFDQAAGFYKKAIALLRLDGNELRKLRVKLAEALANAGRGAEAGPVYATVAESASGLDQLEVQRRAMEQFLVSGRTDEGLAIIKESFGRFGLRLPRGRRRAFLALLWEVIRLRLRGIHFEERPAEQIPPEVLWRLDAFKAAAQQLSTLNGVLMSYFAHRFARGALDCGEPCRVARGLASTATLTAFQGSAARPRATEMSDLSIALSRRVGDGFIKAYVQHYRGVFHWCFGEWEDALAELDRTNVFVAEQQVSFASYRTNHNHFILDCLQMAGRWHRYAAEVAGHLEAGRRRADRYALSAMLVHSYLPALISGRPGVIDEQNREAWEVWPQRGNVMSGYWGLYGRVEGALYSGDAAAAVGLIRREKSALGGNTYFWMMQNLNLLMRHLQGRAALAAAAKVAPSNWYLGQRSTLLRTAVRQARRIEKANMPWSNPLASLLRAGFANLQGRPDETLSHLIAAADGFDAAGMRMYSAAARRQRGRLIGGDEGRELVRRADEFMTAEGVNEPERIAHMLAPGFAN
jgi:eukaryotic-like serine/threonine-protein kinase